AHSSSHSAQRWIACLAHTTQLSRLPYELRTPRVSSPDVERELPGPYMSMSVTLAPMRCRCSAVQPPNAPAPITAISEADDVIAGAPMARSGAADAAARSPA